jgi:lactam utilization protein B
MTWKININSDMGEGFGRWQLGSDEELIPLVPTVNIACGFHAGDPRIMRRVTAAAIAAGADIGPHVALPDLRGFGRRPMDLDYQPDGYPRVEPVKQSRDPDDVVRRALAIVREQSATALDGSAIDVRTPTLCLHGDMPNVLEVTRHVRKRLAEEGIEVVGLAAAVQA